MFKLFLLFFALISICSGREWTSKDGKKIEASFLDYKQGFVFLERADGKKFKVPLKIFNDQDVAFVRAEIAKKRKALGFKDHELFPIQVDGKFGYIDSRGVVIIEPKYDSAKYFSEGLAFVKFKGKGGFINTKGEVEISFRVFERIHANMHFPWKDAYSFSFGLLPFKGKGGKCGYIDKKGDWVIKPEYKAVAPFYEGFAVVQRSPPRGLGFPIYEIINTKGEKLIDKQFRGIGRFSGGLIPVQLREKGSKYGVLNNKGGWAVHPKYNNIFDFKCGLARVWGGDKGNFYIDSKGNEIHISKEVKTELGGFVSYIAGSDFSCGVLVGSVDRDYYFFSSKTFKDTSGPFPYFKINSFSENLASFQKVEKGKFGFLNLEGEVVIKPRFTKINDFKNGLALVEDDIYRMYVDEKGKVIWHSKLKK